MRIIGGTLKSRRLQAPEGLATRPTSDRLRETLFNILAPRIQGAHFLDLFAGSGAVGLEAHSRGASRVDFVERAAPALAVLRKNIENLKIGPSSSSGVSIHAGSVESILRRMRTDAPFHLVFLDPPYDAADAYQATLALLGGPLSSLLAPQALVIAEHRRKENLAESFAALTRTRLLQQGDAALSFYAIPTAPSTNATDESINQRDRRIHQPMRQTNPSTNATD